MAVRNPDNPQRPTNSPNTVYAVTHEVLTVVRKYGTRGWNGELRRFSSKQGELVERYSRRRQAHFISVSLPDGDTVSLSPGRHNQLQASVIDDFRRRFCPESTVLYVGDTAKKMLHVDRERLQQLSIPMTRHDKLPDVVLYEAKRNRIFLVEAVTTHGPLSPKRQIELAEMLKHCAASRAYVSAFQNAREFKKHLDNTARETEVWIQQNPDHMIHFNGPKLFTVHE